LGIGPTPTFAIVIPTRNEGRRLGRLLESIRRQRDCTYSIAVVDQRSTDHTVQIAKEYGCTVIEMASSMFYAPPARSRNAGAKAIAGHILLHLDADMELGSADMLMRLQALIDCDHQAVIIPESDVPVGFWAACKCLERSCYRGTEMEAPRAVTRELFTRTGGYDESISSGEDFYISRLYARETQLVRAQSLSLNHYIGPSSLTALLRKKFGYGRSARAYLRNARAIGAMSAATIVRSSLAAYLKNWRLIRTHPIQFICIVPLRMMEFTAVQLGMLAASRTPEVPVT
jgi:Glycosyl transferase family 2